MNDEPELPLQQFFKWLLVDEQAIDRSPMERVRQPKTPRKLIPVLRDEDTSKLLDACKGNGFANLPTRHRWRHTFAHEWKRAGGDTGDLMLLLGWASDDMPRHYGGSAAAERAQETQARLGIGERV